MRTRGRTHARPGRDGRALSVVLAGGGTVGHIEPALALADALRRHDPTARITALGTARGLETRVVPARGYDLELVPAVPLPRRVSVDLATLPPRLRVAVRATRRVLDRVEADVVVGFGGYVALPAYLAARRRVPVVVHETNAVPGLANRVGARFTTHVAVGLAGTPLPHAHHLGIPLRRAMVELDRAASRAEARAALGLDPDRPTLLVSGGSQGARRLNLAVSEAAGRLAAAGVQVLHVTGPANLDDVPVPELPAGSPPYVRLPFVDRMDLAYAAADLMLCRSGAMTCAELAAVGLPAVYVPLPHGNGEQRRNALPTVAAGGGLLVEDAALTGDWVAGPLLELVTDADRLTAMGAAAARLGRRDADELLVAMVLAAAAGER